MTFAPRSPEMPDPVQRFALAQSSPELWKNGRGMTRTLLTQSVASRHPAGEPPPWSWRISVAELQANGPFSVFDDVDRTLVLLSGGELILHRPDGRAVLDRPGAQVSFRGEESIQATITPAPAQALNVMARRGSVRSTVRVISGHPGATPEQHSGTEEHTEGQGSPQTTAAFVVAGRYEIAAFDASGRCQTLTLHAGEGAAINRSVYPRLRVQLVARACGELDQGRLVSPPGSSDEIRPEALNTPLGSGIAPAPWLILITLESATDVRIPSAP